METFTVYLDRQEFMTVQTEHADYWDMISAVRDYIERRLKDNDIILTHYLNVDNNQLWIYTLGGAHTWLL